MGLLGTIGDVVGWGAELSTDIVDTVIPGSGPINFNPNRKSGGGGSDYLNAAAAGQLGGAPQGHHPAPAGLHASGGGGGGGGGGTSALDLMMLTLVSNLLKNDPMEEPEPAPEGAGLSGTILTRTYGGAGKRRRTYLVPDAQETA